MRLIVMRHGEALLNAQGRLTGQSDNPLSALGELHGGRIGVASSQQQGVTFRMELPFFLDEPSEVRA